MQIEPLKIPGSWQITPKQHGDARGVFLEWFKESTFSAEVGRSFDLIQANCSVSSAGVLRGIHYADVPPGQAKYITCLSGAILDVVVDLRVGSPTYGEWDAVELESTDRRAVFLSEGLGHGFVSLADNSTVAYLCNQPYSPTGEHEVHPLDPTIGIDWRIPSEQIELSPKDAVAPTLAEAAAAGALPDFDSCQAYVVAHSED